MKLNSNGFTLIELLVVMVIIALLVGMLMPALGSVKDYARTIQCMNNLRQLGMAVIMYQNDNGGYFPPAAVDGAYVTGASTENCHRWHGERETQYYDSNNPEDYIFEPRNGMLFGYLAGRQKELLTCPRFSLFKRAGEIEWPNAWTGLPDTAPESGGGAYGYNDTYIGGTHYLTGFAPSAYEKPTRETELGDPTKTIIFADTAVAVQAGGEQYLVEWSFVQPPFYLMETPWGSGNWKPDPTYAWGMPTPTMHFRHSGGMRCNVLFADGHVDSVLWGFTNPINYYGGNDIDFRIGWPGTPGNDWFDAF